MTLYGFRLVSLTLILSVVLPAAFGLQSPPDPPSEDPFSSPDATAPPEPPAPEATPVPESAPLPEPSSPALTPADPAVVSPPSTDPVSPPTSPAPGTTPLPASTDSPAESDREIRNQHLIIAWSKNRDELRGFSTKLGDWDLLKIDAQLDFLPTIGTHVAAVRVGNTLAAFSAEKGWWDVVTLSKDWNGVFQASDEVVTTRDNGHLYTFAAQKGRWTSPTDPEFQKQRQQIAANVFSGSHPQFFQKWIESLPRYEARGVTAEFGRFGLEVETDRRSLMSKAKAELESNRQSEVPMAAGGVTFPGPPATSVRSFSTSPAPATAATPAVPGVGGTAAPTLPPGNFFPAAPSVATTIPGMPIAPRIAIARDPQIQQLRSELDAINAEVEQMAAQTQADSLPAEELRPFVEKSFDLRQELQRLEAQRLRSKLQEIEKALEERQQNRDKLIEQRVKELTTSGVRTRSQSKISSSFSSDAIPKTAIGQPALFAPSKPAQAFQQSADMAPRIKINSLTPPPELEFRLLDLKQEIELQLEERKRREQQLNDVTRAIAKLRENDSSVSKDRMLLRRQEAEQALQAADQAAKEAQSEWQESWYEHQEILRELEAKLRAFQKALEAEREKPKGDSPRALARAKLVTTEIERLELQLKQLREIEANHPELNPDAKIDPKPKP